MCVMRAELSDLLDSYHGPVTVVTGDSGTGKSTLLTEHRTEQINRGALAPPVYTCAFDDGALQLALMESLSSAIALAYNDVSAWERIRDQLEAASKEMALAIGKSLAKAVLQEIAALVRARVGEHVGEGFRGFFKGLRGDHLEAVRADLRRRSDANVVRMLSSLCTTVAAAFGKTLVLSLDESQRLTDSDQRILASLAADPPTKTRIIAAWSLAAQESTTGLQRLIDAGFDELTLHGLTHEEASQWAAREGLRRADIDQIQQLSGGFPLIIEGLFNELRNGGSIDDYTPPTAFTRSVSDAVARLDAGSDHALRMLAAFPDPPAEEQIAAYLGIDDLEWGRIRNTLERERLLSVPRGTVRWFHEQRRRHLWNQLLTGAQRGIVGQKAFDHLVELYSLDSVLPQRELVQISKLATHANAAQDDYPRLRQILGLSRTELAVLASMVELEIQQGRDRWSQPEQTLIYAHSAFDVDRAEAFTALEVLLDAGLACDLGKPHQGNTDSDVQAQVGTDFADPCTLVLHGRAQTELGRGIVPRVTDTIVRDHLEEFRLEATYVVSVTGHRYPTELVALVDRPPFRPPIALLRVPNPMLGIWLRYGDQTLCLAATFNTEEDQQRAAQLARSVSGTSYGQPIWVTRVFADPSISIPTMRFIRSIGFATGRAVEASPDLSHVWMLNDPPPLPIAEYAQRQVDFLKIIRRHCSPLERDIYALDDRPGFAMGHRGSEFFAVDLVNSGRALELTDSAITIITDNKPYRFARLELELPLRPGELTKQLHVSGRKISELVDDPVIQRIEDLAQAARIHNRRQPRLRVPLEPTKLSELLASAHHRELSLAHELSEQLTIGGHRGSSISRSLHVAVFHSPDERYRPGIAYHQPVGPSSDVKVRFISGAPPASLDELWNRAYKVDAPIDEFYYGLAQAIMPALRA